MSGEIPHTKILALISNNPNAPALELAKSRGIPTHVISSRSFRTDQVFHREQYEEQLDELLQRLDPDYICLAGYMLILGKRLVEKWPNKIINIHPSLLPSFKGLRAQNQALEAGVQWTGCTVHLVTALLDDGPILAQTTLEVEKDDTEESLCKRLLPAEHRTYVKALRCLAVKKIQINGNRVAWL